MAPSPTPSVSSTASPAAPDEAIDPAGADLAAKLQAFEHLLDAAYAAAGEVAAATIRARKAHNVSAVMTQPVFASLDKASSAVIQARSFTVKGHRLVEQLARRLDIRADYGDERKDQGDGKGGFTGA